MKNYWTQSIFNTIKPIIAMCHLQALPGDPGYDKSGGMKKVIDLARKDLLALQEGGVDGVNRSLGNTLTAQVCCFIFYLTCPGYSW